MKALTEWPQAACRNIAGVFTDIDDTLTTDGSVTPDVVQALAALRAAGLHVIPITGRPVGWSEPFALQWPVDALVAENGAVALRAVTQAGGVGSPEGAATLLKTYQQDVPTRTRNAARMRQVAQRVLAEIPGTRLAEDSSGRETDIAIDHSEFTHLPPDTIARVVRLMQAEGMNATVSSIHINAWFGHHNKLDGARWIVRELWGQDLDEGLDRWVYIGDSTNDQLMFEHFPHSVGVANVRHFEAALSHKPRYVTLAERGAGFAEMVAYLLAARAAGTNAPALAGRVGG